MIAYKCDRCGKIFEFKEHKWDKDSFYITRFPRLTDSSYDLCPKCNDELKEWFTRKTESDETPWYLKIFNQDILNEYQKRMRDATPEERQSVQDYIDSISQEVSYNDKGSGIHSEVYKEE